MNCSKRLVRFLPSVGFAWIHSRLGKTSIRGNYRMASDRIATFLFGSFIFQSTPGNTAAQPTRLSVPAAVSLEHCNCVLPTSGVPPSNPDSLRQPVAFTASTSVIDPDLQYLQFTNGH